MNDKIAVSHLALIPDGNRRLAKRLMENPWKGYEWGVEKLYKVMEWCNEMKIKIVTFYALSLENLEKRPSEEINFLLLLAKKEFKDIIENTDHFIHKNKIRMNFFGNLGRLPEDIQDKIKKITEITKNYGGFTINFAMAYGGRQEIINAARSLHRKMQNNEIKDIDEDSFRQTLSTSSEPDLIIRTGGEKRLSNFLPFQSVYSELAFVDTFWPEFSKEEFSKVIEDFSHRHRRFGE